MLKTFYPANEFFYECEVCSEPITNPICPVCLAAEIDVWSTNYPNLRRELLPKLKGYLKRLERNSKETIQCIRCGKERVYVCSYCFIKNVLESLEEIDASKIVKKEFLQFFNYYSEPPEL